MRRRLVALLLVPQLALGAPFALDNSEPVIEEKAPTGHSPKKPSNQQLSGIELNSIRDAIHLLRSRAKGMVNVEEYRHLVAGDDWTAAIQTAISSVHAAGGGIVFVPRGTYTITSTLTVYDNVTLRGAGFDRYVEGGGTEFRFRPTSTADFMIVKRNPAKVATGIFGNVVLEGFWVSGDGANARDGIYIQGARVQARNVGVYRFAGKAWRFKGLINSTFDEITGRDSDYGFYFDPRDADEWVSTSTSIRSSYFRANRVGGYIQYGVAITLSDWTIFESNTEHGLLLDDCWNVSLVNPYWENNAGSLIKAGYLAERHVYGLTIVGGYAYGGPLSKNTADAFDFSDVSAFDISILKFTVEKASLLRTGAATGFGTWRVPQNEQQSSLDVSDRQDSTAYSEGDVFKVGALTFVVTQAGTSASSEPAGYVSLATAVTDGTMVARAYGNANQGTLLSGLLLHNPAALYRVGDVGQLAAGGLDLGSGALRNRPTLVVGQSVATLPFIEFSGSLAADATKNLTTWTTGANLAGYARVRVNGSDYWMPFYSAPTGP